MTIIELILVILVIAGILFFAEIMDINETCGINITKVSSSKFIPNVGFNCTKVVNNSTNITNTTIS